MLPTTVRARAAATEPDKAQPDWTGMLKQVDYACLWIPFVVLVFMQLAVLCSTLSWWCGSILTA
jgi:hypothetical protein